jgi:hypothetical protein
MKKLIFNVWFIASNIKILIYTAYLHANGKVRRRAYGTQEGLRDAGGLTGRRRAYGNLGSR